jgi:hypothetical protein
LTNWLSLFLYAIFVLGVKRRFFAVFGCKIRFLMAKLVQMSAMVRGRGQEAVGQGNFAEKEAVVCRLHAPAQRGVTVWSAGVADEVTPVGGYQSDYSACGQ